MLIERQTIRWSRYSYGFDAFRFSFNGQEKIDEISGSGNHNTALFWEYDTRLGRRWNIDPVIKPWESGYATFADNPVLNIDPNGDVAGDYYNKKGEHLGSDGEIDDKAYIADGKNTDGTFQNAKELNISNSVLNQFANTIAVESGSDKSGSWQESFGIGLAIRNMSTASKYGGSIYNTISGGEVFGFSDGGNSTEYKNNSEFSMQAALYSVLGGYDFTNGATKWDGLDFLAWGLNSPNGTPHNKFEEYGNIYIENSIYSSYKNSLTSSYGNSVRYKHKGAYQSFAVPAPVFENMGNWKLPSLSLPWFGFMYNTGTRTSKSLDAAASFGNTIFWKVIKE
jgi:hypothetical protein